MLAVSIDRDPRKAEKFVKETGLDLPFYHDGPEGLAKTLDLPALPSRWCSIARETSCMSPRADEPETLEELRDVVERISSAAGARERASGRERMMRSRVLLAALVGGRSRALGMPGARTCARTSASTCRIRSCRSKQDAREEKENLHWIEAREGSTGGAGGAGGGCACN